MSQNADESAGNVLISMIAAVSDNGVIGRDNQLPWHLPEDLKHFRSMTMGKAILMGRLTYESIGKALPGRRNLVLSRDRNWTRRDAEVFETFGAALEAVAHAGELVIIGGARIYSLCLAATQRLYLTQIHKHVAGDTYFPEINMQDWTEIDRDDRPAKGDRDFAISNVTLERRA